jgi:hypothetical protein
MAKLPRLDEVFLVSKKNLINVGSAYSLKKEGGFPNKKNLGPRQYGSNIGKGKMTEALKPEFQSIAEKHAKKLADELGVDDVDTILKCMEEMMHEVEGAEGEDPAELDKGGPEPGSTGDEE